MQDEINVLIVDDSALMRGLIGRMVEETPGLTVGDKAMNGYFALQKIPRVNPDIIVLDLEMPGMNGIEFLKERKERGITIPVVILSSAARRGAEITMEALALGASDFIQKPSGAESEDIRSVKDVLAGMLIGYGGAYRRRMGKKVLTPGEYAKKVDVFQAVRLRPVDGGMGAGAHGAGGGAPGAGGGPPGGGGGPPVGGGEGAGRRAFSPDLLAHFKLGLTPRLGQGRPPERIRLPGKPEVVAIGISTGGPDALREVFAGFDRDLPVPVLVVQHMPPGFTGEFAKSLNRLCPLEVKEAEEGDLVVPGRVFIARGNKHLEVERKPLGVTIHLSDEPAVSGHRPSADVLFASVARTYRNHALGVIMTGMGRDGASELGSIYREGGMTLGQDEGSAVVYGMPRAAWEMGHVMEQVSLANMARRICAIAKTAR